MAKQEQTLALWNPLADLESLGRWPFRGLVSPGSALETTWGVRGGFLPAIDVTEDAVRYTVTAELAGAKKEDVTVEVEDQRLTIRGEKRSEREEKSEQRRHVERSYGTFSRTFTLPVDADCEHVDATFSDGVLTLQIRKTEVTKPKTVDIKG